MGGEVDQWIKGSLGPKTNSGTGLQQWGKVTASVETGSNIPSQLYNYYTIRGWWLVGELRKLLKNMVGDTGIEPVTSCV